MSVDLILGVVILAVLAGLLLMGTRCSFVTLALCGGSVLADNLRSGIQTAAGKVSVTIPGVSLAQILQLAVTVLPAVLVALHFYHSQKGLGVAQQAAPAVGATGLLVVFVQPVLTQSRLSASLDNSPLWSLINSYHSVIITYALVISLVGIMLESKPHRRRRRRSKKED